MKTSKNNLVLTPRCRISLWDMIQLFMRDFEVPQRLWSVWSSLKESRQDDPAGTPSTAERKKIISTLDATAELWLKIDLTGDLEMIQNVISCLKNTPYKNYSEVTEALGIIISKTRTELEALSFACIPINKDRFFEQSELFGKAVKEACSDEINAHIKDAGNCLAAELNTAAAFHLMLVAEFGMRALANCLKVELKNIPTKEAGWSSLIKKIKKEIERRETENEATQNKEEKEFLKICRLSNEQVFFFKEIWRDNTMHAQIRFNEAEALGVFERVKKFMQILETRIPLK